jgi:phosphatidylserine/phosphatidylglycerophosphate/cardiolipin synthase-like enzyme
VSAAELKKGWTSVGRGRACVIALGLASCAVTVASAEAELELVESVPSETSWDHPDIRDSADVWIEMFDAAQESVDAAFFYGAHAPGDALEPVLRSIESAAERGVRVRVLLDAAFLDRERGVHDRWANHPRIEVRNIDFSDAGGVMHAKYFVVDRDETFVGSQNLDWRALEHIVELGVRVREPNVSAGFLAVFERDWAAARGDDAPGRIRPVDAFIDVDGRPHRVAARFSPGSALVHPAMWDWPELRAAIDGARRSVDLQAMSYDVAMRDGTPWQDLDQALRRAAARGVRVRLLVAGGLALRHAERGALQRLGRLPGVEVRALEVPEHTSGPIPFARLSHRKLLVVDDLMTWIGSSNFSGDYFERSRNAGLIIRGETLPARIEGLFQEAWIDAEPLP